MRNLLLFLFVFTTVLTKAQISGSLNLNTAPKETFIGEFSGFNDGMFNAATAWGVNIAFQGTTPGSCSGLNGKVDSRIYTMNNELEPTLHRFPGGEMAHIYHRYLAYGFGDTNNIAHKLCTTTYPSGIGTGQYDKSLLVPNLATYGITQQDANDNTIFPFINKITNNRTVPGRTVYVLNILEHYRKAVTINGTTYNPRQEVFDSTKRVIYESITTLAQLESNANLSIAFKKAVYNNIDGIMTLINNGVAVPFIELGNEMNVRAVHVDPVSVTCKSYDNLLALLLNINPVTTTYNNNSAQNFSDFMQGNSLTFYTKDEVTIKPNPCNMQTKTISSSDVESLFWWHVPTPVYSSNFDPNTTYTLDCYAALCKMYINIIKNLRPNDSIRFGMFWNAGGTSFDGVWRYQYNNHSWCDYLKTKQTYIGFDDYILHPYFKNESAFTLSGDVFFDTSLTNINAYLQQGFGASAQGLDFLRDELPAESKIWLTEWDILGAGAFNFNTKLSNTFLDAYFYSEFLFDLVEANTIPTRKNLFSISNKYGFNSQYASGSYGGLFHVAYSASDSTQLTNSSATFKKKVLYHIQKILLPIINNTKDYKYINIANGGFTSLPNGVKIRVFKRDTTGTPTVGGNAGELLIYFYNTSGTAQTLNLNGYLSNISQNIIPGTSLRYNSTNNKYKFTLWSDKMSASRGKIASLNDETIYNDATKTIRFRDGYLSGSSGEAETLIDANDLDSSSNFKINRYEIGYIRIPLVYGASAQRKAKENDETEILMQKFSIYPNPAKDYITIEYAGEPNKTATIELYNLMGQLAKQKTIEIKEGINQYNIITQELAKGMYVVKLKNGTEIKTEKIIIQ